MSGKYKIGSGASPQVKLNGEEYILSEQLNLAVIAREITSFQASQLVALRTEKSQPIIAASRTEKFRISDGTQYPWKKVHHREHGKLIRFFTKSHTEASNKLQGIKAQHDSLT